MKKYSAITSVVSFLLATSSYAVPELVNIGDPGNSGKEMSFGDISKPYSRGAVNYSFRIGKNEVSKEEYCEFLNSQAASADPYKLYSPDSGIKRSGTEGSWNYSPAPGEEKQPVNFVSRTNAARYCNWLTSGSCDKGAYKIITGNLENGQTREVISGYRDTTSPDSSVVYFLPDMHEFYKAGFYNGKSQYKEITDENRKNISHYGISNHASGLREWIENRYNSYTAFALGADESSKDSDEWNAVTIFKMNEDAANAKTGFRIAATASISLGETLNSKRNFFYESNEKGYITVRSDGTYKNFTATIRLKNFKSEELWTKEINIELKKGVNKIPLEIPENDGYYELNISSTSALFGKTPQIIPIAVMKEDMPDFKGRGNYGLTVHITRQERRFTFEAPDFEMMRKLGLSIVRVDVKAEDTDGNLTALKRIHQAGFTPLAIISGGPLRDYATIDKNMKENPGLVKKWAKYDIAPEFAFYAEMVYNIVSSHKDIVHDWEMGNEPTFWKITAEDYAQALKSGYKAAKLADPSCNVMAGDLNAIHAPVLKNGAAGFCDSIASHIYGFYVPSFWGIIGKMRELNAWKNAAGIPDKPVWLTEIGVSTYNHMHIIPVRTLDEVRLYQALPKAMTGGLAFGASKVLPYNYRDVPVDSLEEEFGMIDRNAFPKQAACSFRTTAKLTGDAKFTGFLKGHSEEEGGIVGLCFKDTNDVIALWRNDVYGSSKFSVPVPELIKADSYINIKSKDKQADLYDMCGGKSMIKAENGELKIPVNEYPVFVRGHFDTEKDTVLLAHKRDVLKLPSLKVKIIAEGQKSCDLMSGSLLELPAGTRPMIRIHVYNLSGEARKGTLKLIPASSWREFPWTILPSEQIMEIPANGMQSASFSIPVPPLSEDAKKQQIFFMTAEFTDDKSAIYQDTAAFKPLNLKVKADSWMTYNKAFKLQSSQDKKAIKITWNKNDSPYIEVSRKQIDLKAENANELPESISVSFKTDKASIGALSIRFRDKNDEVYQIKQAVLKSKQTEDGSTKITFNPKELLNGKGIIIYGGDKNKSPDFPLSFTEFTFDFSSREDNGSLLITDVEW